MSRHQVKDAFEIEFREPPTYDLTTNRETWTGTLLLCGEDTGVTATQVVQRFNYYSTDEIKAELMRYAIREFTRRWRVAVDAERRLEAIEARVEAIYRQVCFQTMAPQ